MLTEIDWSSTFRVLKGNTELTNFSEHELNSFKVKIRTEELPTLDNLVKRKPHVYSSKWKCPMCLKDKETYTHLWKCEHLGQVNWNMIGKFQQHLHELILANSQVENVNSDDIFKEILRCRILDFNKAYNLSMLAKGKRPNNSTGSPIVLEQLVLESFLDTS
ncbi:3929_t:CDS:2 [Rhizophagus irregularis]|nr:3929_t:CDS:2 [Rhizophagus irregularis]